MKSKVIRSQVIQLIAKKMKMTDNGLTEKVYEKTATFMQGA